MNGGQVAMIVWLALRLMLAAANDGQPIKPPHDRVRFSVAFVHAAIVVGLLWWGGFWRVAT